MAYLHRAGYPFEYYITFEDREQAKSILKGLLMSNQLLTQFDLHHRLYNNVLDGFTDAETNQRLYEDQNINHVKYLAGHILNSQYGIALLANAASVEPKWNKEQ